LSHPTAWRFHAIVQGGGILKMITTLSISSKEAGSSGKPR